MVLKPGKITGANKDAKIYVGRSTTVHVNILFFSAHTLCMNNSTKRFYWLVLQYGVNNYCVLCTVMAKTVNNNLHQ